LCRYWRYIEFDYIDLDLNEPVIVLPVVDKNTILVVSRHEVHIINDAWLGPKPHLRNPRLNEVPRPKLRPVLRW